MILAALGLRIVLTRKLSTVGEMTVWIANWMVCIFNFALAVLEVRMYVFQEQSFTKFGLHLPTVSIVFSMQVNLQFPIIWNSQTESSPLSLSFP